MGLSGVLPRKVGMALYPRPDFTGDYLAGRLVIVPGGRVYGPGTLPDFQTIETLPIPGGLVANTVYEVCWLGDTEIFPAQGSAVTFRMGALYGNGALDQSAELFRMSWTAASPVPAMIAPFECPQNFDQVQFVAQIMGSGQLNYGSGPGGLLFAVKAVGNLQSITVVTS